MAKNALIEYLKAVRGGDYHATIDDDELAGADQDLADLITETIS